MGQDLTRKEKCDLKLKCWQAIVMTASKLGIDKGTVLNNAKNAYEWVIEEDEPKPEKAASNQR